MFSNKLKRSLVTLTVMAGLLAVAGPASAELDKSQEVAIKAPTSTQYAWALHQADTLRADCNVGGKVIDGGVDITHTVTCLDQDLNSVRGQLESEPRVR